jgi:hypothetical protein
MRICGTRAARLGVAVLLGLLGSAPSALAVVSINVGSTTGVPGGTAQFQVTMSAGGAQVGAAQNNITFDPLTPIASCILNPLLVQSGWSPQPSGQAKAEAASAGSTTLTLTGPMSADFPASGRITVIGGTVLSSPITVTRSGNTLTLSSGLPVTVAADTDITVVCTPLVDCTGAKFILLMNQLGSTIPDGSVLYVCTVDVAPNAAPGTTYPLVCSNPSAAEPSGNTSLQAQCVNGQVHVVLPTPTSTATPTPTATATPTPITAAVGAAAKNSTTLTLKSPASVGFPKTGTIIEIDGTTSLSIGYTLGADNTTLALSSLLPVDVGESTQITVVPSAPARAGGGGGGGCQIALLHQRRAGWLLLLPAAVLLWSRRRR